MAAFPSRTSLLMVATLVMVPASPAVTVVNTTIPSPLASVPREQVMVLSDLLQPTIWVCIAPGDDDTASPRISWVSTTSGPG